MGRLTRDPEVRYTQTNNTRVASFSLAVNRRFTRQGEERQADFFNVVAWNKTGEFCSKYFKKGQQVGVIGRLLTAKKIKRPSDEFKKAYMEEMKRLQKMYKEYGEDAVWDELMNVMGVS